MAAALWLAATGAGLPRHRGGAAGCRRPGAPRGPGARRGAGPGRRRVQALAGAVPRAGPPRPTTARPLPVAAFLAGTSKVAALAALLVVVQAVAPLGAPVLTAVAVLAAAQHDPRQRHGAAPGRRRAPARLVHRRPGRLGHPAAGRGVDLRRPGRERLPAGLPRRHPPRVRRGRALWRHLRGPGRRPAPSSSYGSGRGLLREHPLLACGLGLALLSLAGLPPGVLGLVAKVVALRPVVADGLWLLAVVAVGNAVLGIAVYLRWLRLLLGPVPAARTAGRQEPAGRARPARPRASVRRVHPAVLIAVGADVRRAGADQPGPRAAAAPARLSRAAAAHRNDRALARRR